MTNIKVEFDKHVHGSALHALLGFLCNDCDVDVIVAVLQTTETGAACGTSNEECFKHRKT